MKSPAWCCWWPRASSSLRWPPITRRIRPSTPWAAAGRQAHNWTGLVGASVSDLLLQLEGVAAFLLPLLLGALGWTWLRSRPAGSPSAKAVRRSALPGVCAGTLRPDTRPSPLDARPAAGRPDRPAGGGYAGPLPQPSRRGHRDREHGGDRALPVHHLQLQHRAAVAGDPLRLRSRLARPHTQLAFRLGEDPGEKKRKSMPRDALQERMAAQSLPAAGGGRRRGFPPHGTPPLPT